MIQSTSRVGFSTGRDSTTFRDNGTEVSSLSRDKGTTGQAQNLAKGRDGPGQLKSGTGRGTKRDRAEKDVLKQEKEVRDGTGCQNLVPFLALSWILTGCTGPSHPLARF